ncbi:ABC-2 type transport system permease protein [Actinocorallia herbida]|uniref:ABC-2 type transport system permease protein n=1 Tax=Actinocorallia herbida TaxID=58109 RepID=A0A3N1D3T7_9ACTN|nr:ABC transporter permease [Actinocorallia herbida]ROO87728.1 ABC-2 type transport system permease protein [Actinocorallia herbida]
MLSLARSELTQILRNRLVLITGFLLPTVSAAFLIHRHELFADSGGLGYIAAVLVFTVGALGLYSSAVTTLASRRQTLFLKRLRSTAASDTGILTGLLLPVVAVALIQVTALLAVLAVVADAPADPPLLVVAVLAVLAMMTGLGLATAGLTTSPEHAQVTTLPIVLGTIAVAIWVGITGTGDLTALKLLLPGGAAADLAAGAWNGGLTGAEALVRLAPTLAWIGIAVTLAVRLFRWEPRR